MLLPEEISSETKHLPVLHTKAGTPCEGAFQKALLSQMTSSFHFQLNIFQKSLLKSKQSAPISKPFWQDQNTSVLPLNLREKSDLPAGSWLTLLSASPHQSLPPPHGAKLLQSAPRSLLPRLIFGAHPEPEVLTPQKTFFPRAVQRAPATPKWGQSPTRTFSCCEVCRHGGDRSPAPGAAPAEPHRHNAGKQEARGQRIPSPRAPVKRAQPNPDPDLLGFSEGLRAKRSGCRQPHVLRCAPTLPVTENNVFQQPPQTRCCCYRAQR